MGYFTYLLGVTFILRGGPPEGGRLVLLALCLALGLGIIGGALDFLVSRRRGSHLGLFGILLAGGVGGLVAGMLTRPGAGMAIGGVAGYPLWRSYKEQGLTFFWRSFWVVDDVW